MWFITFTLLLKSSQKIHCVSQEKYHKFTSHTPEELFAFADNIHDADPNCRWESAGSLKNGKVVFGTVDIPRTMVLDPQGANDQTKLWDDGAVGWGDALYIKND